MRTLDATIPQALEFILTPSWIEKMSIPARRLKEFQQPRLLGPTPAAIARELAGLDWNNRKLRLWLKARACELLWRIIVASPTLPTMFPRSSGFALWEKASQCLQEQLVEPLRLKTLARKVGCSPHHLSRMFSQTTGETLSSHLRSLRLHRARNLLEAGTHNVTQAAMEVGYSSISHFSRQFRRLFGLPPSNLASTNLFRKISSAATWQNSAPISGK